ncbi:hypothetical protein DL93DRAFT_310945 [Clavulina sp. PMI_390]|nr:hypothetical protein DL93DRAFT_310945 [Clavulina sp. PMI_390]
MMLTMLVKLPLYSSFFLFLNINTSQYHTLIVSYFLLNCIFGISDLLTLYPSCFIQAKQPTLVKLAAHQSCRGDRASFTSS